MGRTGSGGRTADSSGGYRAVAERIVRRLDQGEWAVGSRLPSYRQLAREYGVSLRTLQRALAVVRAEGRVRIAGNRPAVAALGAPLESVLNDAIAFVLWDRLSMILRPGLYGPIWRGIVEGVAEAECSLVILQHPDRWVREFPAGLRHLPLRGVLLQGPFPADLLKQYEGLGLPVVLLDQPGSRFRLHSITVENHEAAFDATSRMIAGGHRQIAFVRSVVGFIRDIDPDAKERQAGFLAACRRGGLEPGQYRVFSAGFGSSSATAQELLRARPRFTAVLTAGEAHARQLAGAASAAGLSIPRDLSVVTFGSTDSPNRNWSGPRVDFAQFGRLGVEILCGRPRALQRVRIRPVWHEGDSLGPPPRRLT